MRSWRALEVVGQAQRESGRRPPAARRRVEYGISAGRQQVQPLFTATGVGGNEVAACCSACQPPARRGRSGRAGSSALRRGTGTTGAWPEFTLNYGLRLEHEDGLREIDDHIRRIRSERRGSIDAGPRGGTCWLARPRGGLVYAGVGGANTIKARGDQTCAACRRDAIPSTAAPSFAAATGSTGRRGAIHRQAASSEQNGFRDDVDHPDAARAAVPTTVLDNRSGQLLSPVGSTQPADERGRPGLTSSTRPRARECIIPPVDVQRAARSHGGDDRLHRRHRRDIG
jgi:hypothetical protein